MNLETTWKKIWHDPVWSKVIGNGIYSVIIKVTIAVITAIGGIAVIFPNVRGYLAASSPVPHWVPLLSAALFFLAIVIAIAIARRSKPRVKIKLISVYHRVAPTKLAFATLKVYCEMRNDSNRAVDLQISKYIPNELNVVSPSAIAALQLKFQPDDDPCPQKAVERVAVFPGQRFTAWIAPDETLFKEALFDRLRSKMGTGEMGTLVLNVDDQEYPVPL